MLLPLIGLIPLLPLAGFLACGLFGKRLPRAAVSLIACGSILLAFVVALGAVVELRSLPNAVERQPSATEGSGSQRSAQSFTINYWTWIPSIPFAGDSGTAGAAGRRPEGIDRNSGAPENAAGLSREVGRSSIEHGSLEVPFGFRLDPLSAIMVLIVTGVGFLIHLYSTGYMAHDAGYARYFAYLNLFMAMMLTLVLGSNFLVMFVGWEGVGLCSYLLIGFWYDDPEKAQAGRKAFLTNRIGDFAFILAMLAILYLFHTLEFSKVMTAVAAGGVSTGLLTAIALALFVGACGKSAQIPLFVWLPDAMAGPTPVSALIHAATMVTAGVYMVARCSVLFVHAPAALAVVAIVGAATALFAATIGLAQNDIKKVLAYSTVSQLGYMFLGLGVGAFSGAIFHLMTHAFFKALLFLGAGSVIHAMSNEQDLRKMGGLAKKLPWTCQTMWVGALAIAGVPGFSGFFSKDEILWKAWETGHPVLWAVGAAAAALTAFYMFRLINLAFRGNFRGTHDQEHHLHESPGSMIVPLVVLAALSLAGGWIGVPNSIGRFVGIPNSFEAYLEPVFANARGELLELHGPASSLSTQDGHGGHDELGRLGGAAGFHGLDRAGASGAPAHALANEQGGSPGATDPAEYAFMLIAVMIAVCGILLARRFYRTENDRPARAARAAGPVYRLVLNKYWVDELYDASVLKLYYAGAGAAASFDRWVVDGLVNAVAAFTELIGQTLRLFQTGFVRNYALFILLGAVVLVWALGR